MQITGRKKPLYLNLLFIGLVIFLFLLNYYQKTIFMRPGGPHQWRQCDCLSITKNYYEEGMHFFNPKVHYNGTPGGRAVSECPLLNYSAAVLWKIFGEHEFLYRLMEYLIFLLSVFVLFNTVLKSFRSGWMAFYHVTFLLTSPLLVFYSINFIADVPAFSCGLMAFCLFFEFYDNKKVAFFYIALFFGTLAVLMKASAMVALGLIYFFSLTDMFGLNRFFKTEKLFANKIVPALFLLLSGTLVLAWYLFALDYNGHNTNNIFLLTVLPIWEMKEGEIISNARQLFNTHLPVFLNKTILFLFFSLVVFVISGFGKLRMFLKYAFVFTALFFVLYILFFFQVFSVHDYYLTNLMIFPVVTLFCVGDIFLQINFMLHQKKFLVLFFPVFFFFNALHAAAIHRLRMIKDDKLVSWYPFISAEELNLTNYLFWDYSHHIGKVEKFSPVLRQHGINREDFVISIPDQSFNISLYFMDQKGHGIAKHHLMEDSTVLERVMKFPASYLVLSDTSLKQTLAFRRMKPRFESYFYSGGVEVFKIKPR